MTLTLRPGNAGDSRACGLICYTAFKTISESHGFPPDFPDAEYACGLMSHLFSLPHVYSVVAEREGEVIGSNFLWEDTAISGIGPITVAPDAQNSQVGRQLMEAALERVREKGTVGVRLVQAAFHNRSLALYSRLGFEVREPLAHLNGPPIEVSIPGYEVRPLTTADLDTCNSLCRQVHGHDRAVELSGAADGTGLLVEHADRVVGYTSGIGYMGHTVGENNEAIKALIGATRTFVGPGFLVPTRNGELFRWCLSRGFRIVQPATLMSLGMYQEPKGAFLPSILY